MFQPLKVKLSKKDALQLDSDLYLYQEGQGMCQDGCVDIFQKRMAGDVSHIRFHKNDIKRIVDALQGKKPIMNAENNMEAYKAIEAIEHEMNELFRSVKKSF